MDSYYRYTRAEISFDNLRHNLREFRRVLPPQIKIMAVLKADAYGHGAVPMAREVLACGVDYLAVAFLDEALELRRAGVDAPLLVLGYTAPEHVERAIQHDLTLTVYTREVLHRLKAARKSKPVKIHIKLDTGMGRIGIADESEAIHFIEEALSAPGIDVEGLYTHYACADEKDKSYTYAQYEKFRRIISHFAAKNIHFPLNHAGNSATAIDIPGLALNMVRLGISMYGLYPSQEVNKKRVNLRPVMSFKTGIVMVKKTPSGTGISYGATYRTRGEETIATLPVGYADGYTRMLSGKAHVLVHGQRVPVVGRICMDQCMINVSRVPDVQIGDEVVLFGEQGGEMISADEVASWLGTIGYEIVCMVSNRVPRVYVRNGQTVATVNRLLSNVGDADDVRHV